VELQDLGLAVGGEDFGEGNEYSGLAEATMFEYLGGKTSTIQNLEKYYYTSTTHFLQALAISPPYERL
jgi:hypothetical protein